MPEQPTADRVLVCEDGVSALLVGVLDARLPRLSRQRMGLPGRRRRAAVREAQPRGLPGGPVVADDPAQARRVPRGVRRLRLRARRALRRARRPAPARRRRHRAPSRQDRSRHQQRPAGGRARRGGGIARPLRLGLRARPPAARTPDRLGQLPATHARVSRAREGPQAARLAVRRPDDRLRLHAGDGPRQRPPRGLRRARAAIEARKRFKRP